jgi:hypothetical protein
VRAFDDWSLCTLQVPLMRNWCTARWGVWVESAWFSFLSCSAFPWFR